MSADPLVAFWSARLDEDEATAKAATDGPWYEEGSEIRGHNRPYAGGDPGILVVKFTWPQESAHIVRHDPARELREVEADRLILRLHTGRHECPGEDGYAWYGDGEAPWCPTVRARLAVHRGHPEYRAEWAPSSGVTFP